MRSSRLMAAWAARALRRQEMPWDEIRAVLSAGDPVLVHRYLELHAERLDEWVVEQRRVLASLERSLTGATTTPLPRRPRSDEARVAVRRRPA
jgi:hypothetical protein